MTAPKRLIDDGSAFDRALLHAGREDRPSSAYERRVIAAASTLSASASAAAGHPSWLSRLVRPQYLAAVVAIGVGTAFVSSTGIRQRGSSEAAPSAANVNASSNDEAQSQVKSAPSPATTSSETSAEASPHAAPVTTPEALPSAPAPAVTAVRASVSAPAPVEPSARVVAAVSSSGVSLQREVELLDSVKQSLRSGAHADAQRALDAYDSEFPSGTLKPEAGFLRIRLLLAKGDRAKARALGDELRTRYPKGVHARRIEAALAADAANEGQDQASPR